MGVAPAEGGDGDFLLQPPAGVHNAVDGEVAGPVVQAGMIQHLTVHYQGEPAARQDDEAVPVLELGATVPRTRADIERTRRRRPNLWEYLLYAGELRVGLAELETKRLDHSLGHRIAGQVIQDELSASRHLAMEFRELLDVAHGVAVWMSKEAQEKAFGPPGVPGDPELITHIARRLLSTYESLMDRAIALRSVRPPSRMATLFEIASRYPQAAIDGFDAFVETLVRQVDHASTVLARQDGTAAHIEVVYTMTIDPEVIRRFNDEQHRLAPERFPPAEPPRGRPARRRWWQGG
ncbi:hypothetical protein ACFVIM_32760 [Streptomyces sp. NPDC057638]|uniref:hypothetical protein n=1 Tax=Streptomyces sp. NPDC057638 TaxID=3346190 RepID=UPI0036B4BC4E